MASTTLHEDPATLGPEAMDRHRATHSLMEELEAIDWYDQRILATTNKELRTILIHNRDEEKEHAAMLLEWLQRQDAVLAAELKTHLFSTGQLHDAGTAVPQSDEDRGIGNLPKSK